jgi:hypothetical protein
VVWQSWLKSSLPICKNRVLTNLMML